MRRSIGTLLERDHEFYAGRLPPNQYNRLRFFVIFVPFVAKLSSSWSFGHRGGTCYAWDMSDGHWTDEMYDEVFEATCAEIAHRRANQPSFSMADLETMLETAYTAEGNDHDGNGHIWHLRQSASIAACEHCLAEWKKELTGE